MAAFWNIKRIMKSVTNIVKQLKALYNKNLKL